MTVRCAFLWQLTLLLVGLLAFCPTATLYGQAPDNAADTDPEEAEVDPYEVPDGTPEELMQYLQTGAERMRPQSRDDAVRMFNSLDTAAERIYVSDDATPEQRATAANARAQFLSMLQRFGEDPEGSRLKAFLEEAKQDRLPEIRLFAEQFQLQQKLANWGQLNEEDREAVVAEIREALMSDEAGGQQVAMLMRLADTVAETPHAQVAIDLINEVVPKLSESSDPAIASRVPRLKGVVRRLQLPGSKMEIEGTLLNGEPVDWESYRGKVVLVDYWATWCGPCIAELPNVLAAYEAYHDKGFDVLGISLDDNKQDVEEFLAAREIPWRTLYSDDPEANGWQHPMASKYAINGIPRAILVDDQGVVGEMNGRGPRLSERLKELLGPPQPSADNQSNSGAGDTAAQTAQADR